MLGVVVDPGHDVRAPEALRVLERGVRDLLAGLEINEPDDDGCGPQIDRQPVNRTGRAGDVFAARRIDDAIAVTHDRGIERRLLVRRRKVERLPLDAHLSAPHRVALDLPGVGGDAALARQAKSRPGVEMPLELGRRRQQFHPARDFDDAFLALALGDARRRHADAGLPGGCEE